MSAPEPEYFTCAKCTHPYAIVGQHQCLTEAVENIVKVHVLENKAKRLHEVAIASSNREARGPGRQRRLKAITFKNLVLEWNHPSCTFERANQIIDELIAISEDW